MMDYLKKRVLNKPDKLNRPYGRLFCILTLLMCVCTDVPEHCRDGRAQIDPRYHKCGDENVPVYKNYTLKVNISSPEGGTVNVNILSPGGGTVLGSPDDTTYEYGTSVTLTAMPDSGYEFAGWSGDTTSADSSLTIKMDWEMTMNGKGTMTVTACFDTTSTPPDNTLPPGIVKYKVTVSSDGTGATGDGEYPLYATVTVAAGTPPSGKQFKEWTSSVADLTFVPSNSSPNAMFSMPASAVTVMAVFEANDVTPPVDGGEYEFVTIGVKKWMNKNLNIQTDDSWCYNNSADSCKKYGRLYTWDAAKTACPKGWHLPSSKEWNDLVTVTGKKLKTMTSWNADGNGTDDYGFSALPGGYRSSDGGFHGAGYGGYWWTATAGDSRGHAYNRYMYCYYDNVNEDLKDRNYGLSVRCVKE